MAKDKGAKKDSGKKTAQKNLKKKADIQIIIRTLQGN